MRAPRYGSIRKFIAIVMRSLKGNKHSEMAREVEGGADAPSRAVVRGRERKGLLANAGDVIDLRLDHKVI